MKKILITGAGSYVGENVRKYIMQTAGDQFVIDAVDTFGDNWKKADFSQYDVVYHVAGIAEVNGKKGMEQLYYKVNTDLTIEIAKHAQAKGVKQFIFMSSMIVYKETQSLKGNIITPESLPAPNGVYGDSKLKAEEGLKKVSGGFSGVQEVAEGENRMKVCILRPPMIYGPNSKSNLLRLGRLGTKVPFFPNWRNKRSMLYIDNLGEFVKQAVLRELEGTFYPQNRELSADDIIITCGGSEAVLLAFMSCLNPGDEIIVPEPTYANYMSFAISAGAVIRTVTTTIEEGFCLPKV